MRKLIHLIALVVIFGTYSTQAEVMNRKNVKITAGSKVYSDENNKPAPLTSAPIIVQEMINGKPTMVWLAPIGNFKKFLDIDDFDWNKKDNSLTIYREKPLLIFNNVDQDNKKVVEELKRLISQSDKTIEIEMYRLQEKSVLTALINAKKQNPKLSVRIILDKHSDNKKEILEKGSTIEQSLERAGCIVKWKSCDKIMHRKTAIFDGEIFYIGSGNWTDFGLGASDTKGKNWELNIIWKNGEFAKQILAEFNIKWNDKKCTEDKY